MEIIWTDEADKQMQKIIDYYLQVTSLRTTEKITDKIYSGISRLTKFPHIGRAEPYMENTSKKYRSIVVHRNYKVTYRLEKEIIYITGIWDCRQDPQRMMQESGN